MRPRRPTGTAPLRPTGATGPAAQYGLTRVRTLIVLAEPDPGGLLHRAKDRAVAALTDRPAAPDGRAAVREADVCLLQRGAGGASLAAGCTVLDLCASGYEPRMGPDEWAAYLALEPRPDAVVDAHAELVRAAEQLVFIYPTVWLGLPAVLKGWLERTMMPGTAFKMDDDGRVRGCLTELRRIVGVSTYRGGRSRAVLAGDPGRRVLCRALRLSCPRPLTVRSRWIGLSASQTGPAESRFLDRVSSALAPTGGRGWRGRPSLAPAGAAHGPG